MLSTAIQMYIKHGGCFFIKSVQALVFFFARYSVNMQVIVLLTFALLALASAVVTPPQRYQSSVFLVTASSNDTAVDGRLITKNNNGTYGPTAVVFTNDQTPETSIFGALTSNHGGNPSPANATKFRLTGATTGALEMIGGWRVPVANESGIAVPEIVHKGATVGWSMIIKPDGDLFDVYLEFEAGGQTAASYGLSNCQDVDMSINSSH